MVRRYWRVALIGLGVGFLLGNAVFVTLVVTGSQLFRSRLTVEQVVGSVLGYGLCGTAFALAGVAGAGVAVLIIDRKIRKSPGTRVRAASVGAMTGTFLLGLGAVMALTGGEPAWTALLSVGAALLAPVAGCAAAVLVYVRELRELRLRGCWSCGS